LNVKFMNIDEIASIYSTCGFSISKINGSYFLRRGFINYSFPQVIDVPFNNDNLKAIRWKYLISIIKTRAKVKNTYEFILDTNDYNISKFDSKKRADIRKSLRDCVFKRPSLDDLIQFGLPINQQTLAKQGRKDKHLNESIHWKRYITTFYSQENILILGAYLDGKMVGYITVIKINGEYHIIDPYYDFKAAPSAPTQGLIFTLVNQVIEKEGSIIIFYGVESFSPLPSLNKYKQSMLFKRVPATRVYVLNPMVLPFIKLILFFYTGIFKQKSIKNPLIRKMVSLYQGTRVLRRQL
jgi:hypothetical protein